MEGLDTKLFAATTSATDDAYWKDAVIQKGSSHFDLSPNKLTREVFDELIQTLENPLVKVLDSKLLDVEEAKKIQTAYLKRDLSNIDDVGSIAVNHRKSFETAHQIISVEDFESQIKEHLSSSTYYLDSQEDSDIASAINFRLEGRNMSDSSAVPELQKILTVDPDDTFMYKTKINDSYSYFHAFVKITPSKSIPHIRFTSDSLLSISVTINEKNILHSVGEVLLGDGSVSVARKNAGTVTTDGSTTSTSIFTSFYHPFDHTHDLLTFSILSSSNPSTTRSSYHNCISNNGSSGLSLNLMFSEVKAYFRGVMSNA